MPSEMLSTEAGSVAVEKVHARQRPRPGPGAGAQRGFTDLARSRPPACSRPFLPFALPPVPSPGRRAGGRGARAGARGACREL